MGKAIFKGKHRYAGRRKNPNLARNKVVKGGEHVDVGAVALGPQEEESMSASAKSLKLWAFLWKAC